MADPRMLAQALMSPAPVDPYMQEYPRPQERQGRLARALMGLRDLPREMVEGAPVVGDIAASVAQWAQNNPLDAGALAVSPVPVVGDVAGLANDIRHYVNDPESRTWTNYGLSALGTLPFVPPVMATFAGIGAKTADFGALAKAKELMASGAPREDIWRETGWFQGVDGNWRFEIDDSGAKLTGAKEGRLGDVLDHPELYKSYPESADATVQIETDPNRYGSFNPVTNVIKYRHGLSDEELLKTFLHEGQHNVQFASKHKSGANPSQFMYGSDQMTKVAAKEQAQKDFEQVAMEYFGKRNELRDKLPVSMRDDATADNLIRQANPVLVDRYESARKAYSEFLDGHYRSPPKARSYGEMVDLYAADPGEVEARLTEARRRMSAAERAQSYPPTSYDRPVEMQRRVMEELKKLEQ